MAIHAGFHEGRVHFIRLVLLVSPGIQQELDHLQVTLVAGQCQGRLLELVAVGVDACTLLKQDLEGETKSGPSLLQVA